ncbi:MAG: flagellar biosynthesis protein FliQ [Deltaproteobacteria bacterium]|nr:flagellar biosynthesis protein FliQ [Deltaproteobacteria bacterium]
MTPQFVIGFGKQALELTLMLSAPLLITGMIVGLLISIVQAATQIQEMTLVFVPKIVVVIVTLIFFAPWLLDILTTFTSSVIANIPAYVH